MQKESFLEKHSPSLLRHIFQIQFGYSLPDYSYYSFSKRQKTAKEKKINKTPKALGDISLAIISLGTHEPDFL